MVAASPRQGKSLLLCNLLLRKSFLRDYFKSVYLCGPALETDESLIPLYERYKADAAHFYSDEYLQDIIDRQLNTDLEERENICVVFDDLPAISKNISRGPNGSVLSRLSSRYRHVLNSECDGGALIISTQKIRAVDTLLRQCCNCVIVGRLNSDKEIETLLDEYAGPFGGPDNLLLMFRYATRQRYGFLCLWIDGCEAYPDGRPVAFSNFTEVLYTGDRMVKNLNGLSTEDHGGDGDASNQETTHDSKDC